MKWNLSWAKSHLWLNIRANQSISFYVKLSNITSVAEVSLAHDYNNLILLPFASLMFCSCDPTELHEGKQLHLRITPRSVFGAKETLRRLVSACTKNSCGAVDEIIVCCTLQQTNGVFWATWESFAVTQFRPRKRGHLRTWSCHSSHASDPRWPTQGGHAFLLRASAY